MAKESLILTESQIQTLEKKKQDDKDCGGIETAHPVYLGSQDMFYVGTLKGLVTLNLDTVLLQVETHPLRLLSEIRRCIHDYPNIKTFSLFLFQDFSDIQSRLISGKSQCLNPDRFFGLFKQL